MSEALEYRLEQSALLPAPPAQLFDFLDDFEQLGAHMMKSNWMMAGARMRYEFDSDRGRAAGARVRLTSSFLGIGLEIDEQITGRFPPREKSWRTCAGQRMLILSAYHMGFWIDPERDGSCVHIFIEYSIPPHGLSHWLGWLFARFYARWCVSSMLAAAVVRFSVPTTTGEVLDTDTEAHRSATP